MTDPKTDGTSVARRALDLLSAFDVRSRRLTLSEMAARCNLPVPTAYRLVKVLTEWGALERGSDRRYEIGRRVWELGLLADVQTEIRQIAAPFLQDLFVATREAVYLAVRQGKSALYVDRLTGRVAPKVYANVGSRLPLHATGVGKVLLAHSPEDVTEDVLAHLRQYTPYTGVDQAKLRRELAVVRQRGFARTMQELDMSTASIAVPIFDSDGLVESALGLVTSDLRKDLSRVLPALHVAAQGIGRSLPPRHGDLFT
ncbi:IclR family transcriptional regulator (plasmid) [Glaciihabitans sp. INWT7]|uniref:IclR family transcriptional regulator n=1 Tax=Glaciihabitans sp. INWT7 TaxID=2596912 RepID=UPI0016286499|nr:IclR family transcriptional regulator [Glaciihabitans sp. INWT7]QNE48639.1 IclR family transcriptional regulator [Glaciihabitans sp. INWT7]